MRPSKETISIIIPVFNKEKTLDRCLKSIFSQSYRNVEVIAIDDGSTDSSLMILNKFKKEHNNFKIFSQKNLGVSTARNIGLDKATGDFVTFVDADDYIKKDYITTLISKKNADLIISGLAICLDSGKKFMIFVI